MTKLGDAELTEQGIMSLSEHKRPDAARRYAKNTEINASPLPADAAPGAANRNS